jgi:hypothetical protein
VHVSGFRRIISEEVTRVWRSNDESGNRALEETKNPYKSFLREPAKKRPRERENRGKANIKGNLKGR